MISIISLLIALLMPALGKSRESAKTIMCASNHRQTCMGLEMYASDSKRWIPSTFIGIPTAPDGSVSSNYCYAPISYGAWRDWDGTGNYMKPMGLGLLNIQAFSGSSMSRFTANDRYASITNLTCPSVNDVYVYWYGSKSASNMTYNWPNSLHVEEAGKTMWSGRNFKWKVYGACMFTPPFGRESSKTMYIG